MAIAAVKGTGLALEVSGGQFTGGVFQGSVSFMPAAASDDGNHDDGKVLQGGFELAFKDGKFGSMEKLNKMLKYKNRMKKLRGKLKKLRSLKGRAGVRGFLEDKKGGKGIPDKKGKRKLMKKTLKQTLYDIIFEADTKTGKAFDVSLLILILISVVLVMLESVPWIGQDSFVLYGE